MVFNGLIALGLNLPMGRWQSMGHCLWSFIRTTAWYLGWLHMALGISPWPSCPASILWIAGVVEHVENGLQLRVLEFLSCWSLLPCDSSSLPVFSHHFSMPIFLTSNIFNPPPKRKTPPLQLLVEASTGQHCSKRSLTSPQLEEWRQS